ncbi:MAG: LysM peptidoglycan-binding domain-containing protein [Actinobacteria bacterium]|nr:LysM peptidoglycan-binding domain-containing protein [Actinomycetota bacterium]
MSDHETESFTPYEPQTSYDWDYGDQPPPEGGRNVPNVLWGRLAALGLLALIAFLLGRWSAPNGVDSEQLAAARADNRAAQARIEELEAALQAQPTVSPTPSITVDDQTDEADDATFDGETYTIQSGDTLRDIAERFCGDPTEGDLIADFNGIADPTLITPGTELKIPEDCGD